MKFFKKYWSIVFLTVILLTIFWQNYTPGTWLAGWDNLMPELNIGLNLKRSLNAVWQEYQGLGLVGGMGHATDSIRQLILLPFILILPHSLIRYLWTFSMLALGTFGIYWGLGKLEKTGQKERIFGALFYLLNFGTIQIFWVPYESFITFWGFFPWLIFGLWQVLKEPNKKNFWRFILINLLAIPSFYIPTLFFVYLLCLLIFGFFYLLSSKIIGSKKPRNLFRFFGSILLLNSFWLLPFFYFLLTNLHHPRLAMINQMASEETFLRNQKRGTLADFFLLKGYYFDFFDGPEPLMKSWQNHFNQPLVMVLGYSLAGVAILGIISAIASKKNRGFKVGLLGIFGLVLIAMLSAILPFSWLNYLIRSWPFFNQVFRSPFTKFIVPTIFSFSILATFGLIEIQTIIKRIHPKFLPSIFGVFLVSVLIYVYPIFQGNLIYERMRVKIPNEYFQLFEYLDKQPKSLRIANLPQGNFWGWTFYRWGLRGSGFIWYGIEQPILDRAFDVWNLKNEQYYWELVYALQRQDPKLLENVFDKYFIGLIVFDDNVSFPGEKEYARLALKTKDLLEKSSNIQKLETFGQISVYRFDHKIDPYLLGNAVSSPPLGFSQLDPVFTQNGHYLVDTKEPNVFYPFTDLFSNRFQQENNYEIEENDDSWLVKRPLPDYIGKDYQLLSDSSSQKINLPINYNFDQADNKKIEEISLSPADFVNPHNCASPEEEGKVLLEYQENQLVLKAEDAALCFDWKNYEFFKKFKEPIGLKIEFEYQSKSDEWPQYCLWDNQNQTCLNNKEWPQYGFSHEWNQISEQLLIDPQKNEPTALVFILDAYQQSEEKQIIYRNIRLKIYHSPKVEIKNQSVMIPQVGIVDRQLIVQIPKIDSSFVVENPISRKLFKLQPKTCNPNLNGSHSLDFHQEDDQPYIRLSAQNADSCLYWYFPRLPLNIGWLAEVIHRHQKEYPLLTAGFDGLGRYKFFYTKLFADNNWKKSYLIVPPIPTEEKGLAFSQSNVSYNQFPTINDIASLRIYPFPWEFLKSIRFENNKSGDVAKIYPLSSSHRYWLYSVNYQGQFVIEKNTLVLPQSYDQGWIGLSFANNKPKLLEHTLIDSWANGWEMENSPLQAPNSKLYLIFWPQLLEYFGLLSLVIFGCFAINSLLKSK